MTLRFRKTTLKKLATETERLSKMDWERLENIPCKSYMKVFLKRYEGDPGLVDLQTEYRYIAIKNGFMPEAHTSNRE